MQSFLSKIWCITRSKRHTPNHYTNRGFNRVTIWAIFTGHVLARISVLPKISRFWLFALCRSIIAWHPRELLRAEQTAPYAYESRSLYFDVIQQSVCSAELEWTKVEWMNKRTHLTCARICITLNALRRSHLLTHHDWSIMYNASYWSIITFSKYDNRKTEPNTEILARMCPVKMARIATLGFNDIAF